MNPIDKIFGRVIGSMHGLKFEQGLKNLKTVFETGDPASG